MFDAVGVPQVGEFHTFLQTRLSKQTKLRTGMTKFDICLTKSTRKVKQIFFFVLFFPIFKTRYQVVEMKVGNESVKS